MRLISGIKMVKEKRSGEEKMKFHTRTAAEAVRALNTDMTEGLRETESARRRRQYGDNRLTGKKKRSILRRFLSQFGDTMILILIAAAAVSFAASVINGETGELAEPILILAIVVVNAVMGVVQESRAARAIDALRGMSAPRARVIRNGREEIIDAVGLVPGDIVLLEAGDTVPADGRILECAGFKADESALTGEAQPADKAPNAVLPENTSAGDMKNMVFSGTCAVCGTAKFAVTATGMETQMGKIAGLMDDEPEMETPLQRRLAQLGRYLCVAAGAACLMVFIAGLIDGNDPAEIFMTAVSLAVSAIPEGLPAVVTIVLAMGVRRMAAKNAIVHSLPAVETLGCASVICTDKTGTLTQNKMTVVKAYCDETGELEHVTGSDGEGVRRLLSACTLCCNGSVYRDGGKERAVGDPTETAIISAALKNGTDKRGLDAKHPRLMELPFDSERKLMTTVVKLNDKAAVIVKGAYDVLQTKCVNGNLRRAGRACSEMAESALRVIAVGYKIINWPAKSDDTDSLENNLTLMGLLGLADPPRKEAAAAVRLCRRAGITPVMITGDHIATASAVARELGIMREGCIAVTGAELDRMSETELDGKIEKIAVYARVTPENKLRVVKAWQRKGSVVAMTGDGVNDAPALKAADIGCAMGLSGTDAARSAADMTLSDDNFATVVCAVKEGRGIYSNIQKVAGFLLGTNMGEILTVFIAMLLWRRSPLNSLQLLWINLVTDGMPAIALGMEPVESSVMSRAPRPKNEGLLSNGFGVRIAVQGLLFGAISLAAYWLGESITGTAAGGQTMTFAVLGLSQLVQAYNMRSEKSVFEIGIFENRRLNAAAAVSAALMLAVLLTPIASVFGLVYLTPRLYALAGILVILPMAITELFKAAGLILSRKAYKR